MPNDVESACCMAMTEEKKVSGSPQLYSPDLRNARALTLSPCALLLG